MSFIDATLIAPVSDSQDNASGDKDVKGNVCSADHNIAGGQENMEIRCFVCDVRVEGRRYALATCKTQNSRARVIEKLGELVENSCDSDRDCIFALPAVFRYVVVITEDDVICRSCANLINTLDRLESEMKSVKNAVLRFLERKYSLAEGELIRCSEVPRLGQPPQITKRDPQQFNYHSRKRGAICLDDSNCQTKRCKKSNVWIQCDECRYTTLRDTFLAHHTRPRTEKKTRCDKCGDLFSTTQSPNHRCLNQTNDSNFVETENLEEEPRAIQTAPLETIDLAGTGEDVDDDVTPIPVIPIPPGIDPLVTPKEEQIQLISLANPSTLQFQNFLANDGTLRDGQPLFMRVLQQFTVGDDLGQASLIPVISNDAVMKAKEPAPKQMLTLAEDGSLEMVAVDCWNDDDNRTVRIPEDIL